MTQKPTKLDRRKFIYAGLGAAVVIVGGLAAYFATRPPERIVETVEKPVERTIVQTQVQTQVQTVEKVITQTVERPVERTIVTTVAGTPTTIVQTTKETVVQTITTGVQKPKLRILYQSTYAPAINDWLTARTFEWAAKRGVDVELSTAAYREIEPKILTGVETGNPPDVAFGAGQIVALLAEDPKARHLAPLDDVLNEIGKDDLIPICRNWYTIEGKQYGIDLYLFVNVTHLIKPFADEVGRKPEELVTWDDYIEFAREVKRRHPDMFPMGFTLGKTFDGTETWYMFWWPYGGEMLTDRKSTAVKFDSQVSRETLQRVVNLYNEGLISPQMLQADEFINNNAYLTRSAAFIVEGPTPFYAAVTRNPDLASKTVLLPPPIGPKGMFVWGSKQPLVIFKDSKYVDLAKDLLIYIFKDRNAYTTLIKNGFYAAYPVFTSVQESLVKEDPVWKDYVKVQPNIYDYTYPLNQPCKGMDEVQSKFIVADLWSMTIIDKKDVDTAVSTVGNNIKEIIRRTYGQ